MIQFYVNSRFDFYLDNVFQLDKELHGACKLAMNAVYYRQHRVTIHIEFRRSKHNCWNAELLNQTIHARWMMSCRIQKLRWCTSTESVCDWSKLIRHCSVFVTQAWEPENGQCWVEIDLTTGFFLVPSEPDTCAIEVPNWQWDWMEGNRGM